MSRTPHQPFIPGSPGPVSLSVKCWEEEEEEEEEAEEEEEETEETEEEEEEEEEEAESSNDEPRDGRWQMEGGHCRNDGRGGGILLVERQLSMGESVSGKRPLRYHFTVLHSRLSVSR
jgi:hypothetical protein